MIFGQSIPERGSANWLPGRIRNEKFPRTGNENEDGARNIRSDGDGSGGTSNKLRPGVQSFVKPASDNEPSNEKEREEREREREERDRAKFPHYPLT